MTGYARCAGGCLPPEDGDRFCGSCGSPTGQIEWCFSTDGGPADGIVRVRPGESFFLVAHNVGSAPAGSRVDISRMRGARLIGVASRQVLPGQCQAFELRHVRGEALQGTVMAQSEDGPRQEWWERRSWRSQSLNLCSHVRIRDERWAIGSPTVLFPPGVRRQYVRIWNDSEQERRFEADTPAGYRITSFGVTVDQRPPAVGAGNSLELITQWAGPGTQSIPDREWSPGGSGETVALERMEDARSKPGADVVVAIDFGTRNTSLRVRWRHALLPGKPAGTVDIVGDNAGNPRFPTLMVLHRQERSFRWGSDAADYVARMTVDEVAVDDLKTDLREGRQRFTAYRREWTNEELLGRYFERLFHRLDEYFHNADPTRPLSRDGMEIRYVVCRPVLDANEGDEKGSLYELALRIALIRCGVPESAIEFVHEPVAAAIGIARQREGELLELPDGTAVAVVDSGGGTTDVALARVRTRGGKVSLDLAGSYAVWLAPGTPIQSVLEHYGGADFKEVGGNLLDCALAHQLETRASVVLESDGRPLPDNVWDENGRKDDRPLDVRKREFVEICRRMKERFATEEAQYLFRAPDEQREGERPPFPNRSEFRGIRLSHDLYDDHVAGPILKPAVAELRERIGSSGPEDIHLSQVRRVFYVGGTNIDGFVRQHFSRAFMDVSWESHEAAKSDERIQERLHAVVDGAVWFDEQLFAASPLTLSMRVPSQEVVVVSEGAALLPAAVAKPRFVTEILGQGEELDAALVASGSGLAEPVTVARAFYRNESEQAKEMTLCLTVSREKGAVAELQQGTQRIEQWRFSLVEGR